MPKILFLMLATLLMSGLWTACTRKLGATTEKAAAAVIALEAFSCRGTCPVFRFTIDEKGMARLEGKRHTALIGEYVLKLEEVERAAFVSIFEQNNWGEIKKDALSSYRDIQRWEVQYQGKRIALHKRSAGKDLLKIVEALEQRMNELAWN